jgi:hypothetical protein
MALRLGRRAQQKPTLSEAKMPAEFVCAASMRLGYSAGLL